MAGAGSIDRGLGRVAQVRPGEGRAALWSFGYFLCVLAAYYLLRPLRDEMGIAGGVRNLPWLFTATFLAMLVAVPAQGALVAMLPRRKFIPWIYNFFVLNLLAFWVLLTLHVSDAIVARIFFVWITVFSVFTVSVFWSFMADLWRSDQAKRLFGFIAAGGSIGTLVGPALTGWLVGPIGPTNLLFVAIVLLELAVFCAMRLERAAQAAREADAPEAAAAVAPQPAKDEKLGGNWLAGLAMIVRSPYLGGIAGWVFLLSLAGTFLYLMQAEIVSAASDDPAVRTRIFASIDFTVGLINIAIQAFLTGRVVSRFGVGVALAFLPLVFILGYGILSVAPVLFVVMIFQTLQRSANFAISNPAREILFTATRREEKYKAKPLIDGVVFRGADALNAQVYGLLQGAMMLGVQSLSLISIPIAALWFALSFWLGRSQEKRVAALAQEPAPEPAQGLAAQPKGA